MKFIKKMILKVVNDANDRGWFSENASVIFGEGSLFLERTNLSEVFRKLLK